MPFSPVVGWTLGTELKFYIFENKNKYFPNFPKFSQFQTLASQSNNVDSDQMLDTNQQEAAEAPIAGKYGLWDHGPSDFKKSFLNCEAIPFSVCMYTRAGLFSAVILIVPAILLALLSAAVLASHGQLHTTGTLARYFMFLLIFQILFYSVFFNVSLGIVFIIFINSF